MRSRRVKWLLLERLRNLTKKHFAMKAVADTLAVARSNLIERVSRRAKSRRPFSKVRGEVFPHNPPTSTAIQVAGLLLGDASRSTQSIL